MAEHEETAMRHRQTQSQLGAAGSTGAGKRLAHGRRHRAGIEHGQRLGQRTAHLTIDGHHAGGKVGNRGIGLQLQAWRARKAPSRAVDLHAGAIEDELARQARQRPPPTRAPRRSARHVGIAHIAHPGTDTKLPRAWLLERKVVQIATHTDLSVARPASHHGFAHIVARRLGNTQGQVAPDPCAVGTNDVQLQIEHTRQPGAG